MPERAIIFANGDWRSYDRLSWDDWYRPGDLLVGADNGASFFARFGVQPDVVIGDLDSLPADELAALKAAGVRVERYPVRKDQTDLELAVEWALAAGAKDVLIFGALGWRWDMTLANMLLLARPAYRKARLRLVDGDQAIMLVRPGEMVELPGRPGDIVSLVPLVGDATGVTSRGLEYRLDDDRLPFGATLGISNTIVATSATLFVGEGLLLCALIHQGQS